MVLGWTDSSTFLKLSLKYRQSFISTRDPGRVHRLISFPDLCIKLTSGAAVYKSTCSAPVAHLPRPPPRPSMTFELDPSWIGRRRSKRTYLPFDVKAAGGDRSVTYRTSASLRLQIVHKKKLTKQKSQRWSMVPDAPATSVTQETQEKQRHSLTFSRNTYNYQTLPQYRDPHTQIHTFTSLAGHRESVPFIFNNAPPGIMFFSTCWVV